jgi:hypothetical protein
MSDARLSLYDLAEEAVALDDLTAMDDGEWTPEADALATELMDKLVAKAGNIVPGSAKPIDFDVTAQVKSGGTITARGTVVPGGQWIRRGPRATRHQNDQHREYRRPSGPQTIPTIHDLLLRTPGNSLLSGSSRKAANG